MRRMVLLLSLSSFVLSPAIAQPVKPDAAPTVPAGVYTGEVHRLDPRVKGMPGCRYVEDQQLTLTVHGDGVVTWVGHSYASFECRDEDVTPSSCWHEGRGQLEPAGKKWKLSSAVTDSIAGPVEGSGRRVWKCKKLRVVLPDELEPADPSCVLLGRDDSEDMMLGAIATEGCRLGADKTWEDLANAVVTRSGANLSLPVHGLGKKKLTLKLTRMANAPTIAPPPPLTPAEVLAAASTHRDEMCDCEDATCADSVRARFDELMAKHGKTRLGPRQFGDMSRIRDKYDRCTKRATHPIQGFKKEMCACTNVSCADEVLARYNSWNQSHFGSTTPEVQELVEAFRTCLRAVEKPATTER